MKRSLLKLVLFFSLSMNLAVVAAFAFQSTRTPNPASPSEPESSDPFAAVELTPDQTQQFDRLRAEFRGYRGECHHQTGQMLDALISELTSETPNREMVDTTLTAMRDRQAATQRRLTEHLSELRKVLRPDQRPEFDRVLRRTMLGTHHGSGHNCKHAIRAQ